MIHAYLEPLEPPTSAETVKPAKPNRSIRTITTFKISETTNYSLYLFLNIKRLYFLVSMYVSSMTVIYNILLITQSCMSVAQASSSFQCLGRWMMPMYTTSTHITKALHHVTYVQLFQ